jgi:hypothetical protein
MQSTMNSLKWSETEDGDEWDDFVARNKGSIFHSWGWRNVLEGGSLKPLYLVCRDPDGTALAVCPFVHGAGTLMWYLDSLPNSHTGGPVIGDLGTNIPHIFNSLRRSVRFSPFNPIVAMKINVHQPSMLESMRSLGFQSLLTHELFILDLHEKTREHIWSYGFQKHDRQAVKYYEQQGLEFGFAEEEDDFEAYVDIRRRVKGKGVAGFLSRIRLHMGDSIKVALVRTGDVVIGGFSMLCDPQNSIVHVAGDYEVRYSRKRNIHSPVTFLYWKAIEWASEQGFRSFDLGAYPATKSTNPLHPFHKLRMRFEAEAVPRYQFVIPTSGVSYSMARRVGRLLRPHGER